MIHPPYEAFYIQSMIFNTYSALQSMEDLNAILLQGFVEESGHYLWPKSKEMLNLLQNIVIHGAALSRYFWPSPTKKTNIHQLRGEQLRTAFNVTDESPLKDRGLRNAIEHLDERLDKYFSESKAGYFFPEYVGNRIDENEDNKAHFFRAYFTDTAEFQILNEKFELGADTRSPQKSSLE